MPELSLRVGDLLGGRFRLESVIRADRACAVLLGKQVGTRAPVDIEIVLAPRDASEKAIHATARDAIDDARVKFLAAARQAMTIESSRLAKIYDAGVTSDGHPYVVREHLASRTLASVLEENVSISTEQAVDVAIDLCEALAVAHGQELTHGELSPHAIHLCWGAEGVEGPSDLKVVGVGTAQLRSRLALAMGEVESFENGALRAPEIVQRTGTPGALASPTVDVWGIGVVLYTMLAGDTPFAAESPSAVNLAIALDEPPCLAGVPDALAEVVERCLSKNPNVRQESVGMLARALLPFGTRSRDVLDRIQEHLVEPAAESVPTLMVTQAGYDELMREMAKSLTDCESTAPRQAITDAMLRDEQNRDASTLDLEIEVGPSVRDVNAAAEAPKSKTPSSIPPPVVVSAPAQRDVPTVMRPRPKSAPAWRTPVLIAAAASLVIGVAIGAQMTRMSSSAPPAAAAAAPPPEATTLAAPLPSAPSPTDLPEAQPPAMEASALPAAAPRPAAKPRPKARASAPEAAPTQADPLVTSAARPVQTAQPETKANDDDLRRFLDDRR